MTECSGGSNSACVSLANYLNRRDASKNDLTSAIFAAQMACDRGTAIGCIIERNILSGISSDDILGN